MLAASLLGSSYGTPEQGKFPMEVQDRSLIRIFKTMFRNTHIRIYGDSKCGEGNADNEFTVTWVIRSSSCFDEYVRSIPNVTEQYLLHPEVAIGPAKGFYKKYQSPPIKCGSAIDLEDQTLDEVQPWHALESYEDTAETPKTRRKRARNIVEAGQVAVTPVEGPYIIVIYVQTSSEEADTGFRANLHIQTESPRGYLSPHEFPLLDFYLLMTLVYAGYCSFWLFACWKHRSEVLRVQYWIMAVLVLGMLEKAVFYSEYNTINNSGYSIPGAAKFAEAVSALKRGVARMLVIVVALGFGITRPRLGDQLHQVIGIGVLYFTLASIEAFVRVDNAKHDPGNMAMVLTAVPLAIIDSLVCWWIFLALTQTMKTLRLRRNMIKLNLYRHFSNTILFCVVASVVFILWDMKLHRFAGCLNQWELLWFDDAFWHVLFSFIVLVIIILWRPSANNQRYAYSPLVDGDGSDAEVEEEQITKGGATEGLKKRDTGGVKKVVREQTAEDDLKWIEENIPQTVADGAGLVDEEEEEAQDNKFQMNKIE